MLVTEEFVSMLMLRSKVGVTKASSLFAMHNTKNVSLASYPHGRELWLSLRHGIGSINMRRVG